MKKGPFKMKGFSGFGNDSPAKHDDKDLRRDVRKREMDYKLHTRKQAKGFLGMTPEISNRARSKFGMEPLFTGANNYKQSFKDFYNLMND